MYRDLNLKALAQNWKELQKLLNHKFVYQTPYIYYDQTVQSYEQYKRVALEKQNFKFMSPQEVCKQYPVWYQQVNFQNWRFLEKFFDFKRVIFLCTFFTKICYLANLKKYFLLDLFDFLTSYCLAIYSSSKMQEIEVVAEQNTLFDILNDLINPDLTLLYVVNAQHQKPLPFQNCVTLHWTQDEKQYLQTDQVEQQPPSTKKHKDCLINPRMVQLEKMQTYIFPQLQERYSKIQCYVQYILKNIRKVNRAIEIYYLIVQLLSNYIIQNQAYKVQKSSSARSIQLRN